MYRKVSHVWRISASFMVVCALMLIYVPEAWAVARAVSPALVGPGAYYLALGDSLAFGFQPDLDFTHGYANDLYSDLKGHGVGHYANLACPGETTVTMIGGGCPYPLLRKSVYLGPQLTAAVNYLHSHVGQVSPVTLDIGANDLIPDLDSKSCTLGAGWSSDLAAVDDNLTHVILPQLVAALTVGGKVTGDLLLMDYYDPYQNLCPNTVNFIRQLNAHLERDAAGLATFVDIFPAFGGATTPDPETCSYTWMCSLFKDIHAQDTGYSAMASAFERAAGY